MSGLASKQQSLHIFEKLKSKPANKASKQAPAAPRQMISSLSSFSSFSCPPAAVSRCIVLT